MLRLLGKVYEMMSPHLPKSLYNIKVTHVIKYVLVRLEVTFDTTSREA